MTSTTEKNTPPVVYRPVEKYEQKQAFDLWYSVFKYNPGYFERYFTVEASPRYQNGDTLGAWYDGQLVSAVHIRRIMLRSRDDDGEYLCAAISNVATLEKYRKRGFSSHLLQRAIEKMEQSDEFDVSILRTGIPKHYSILGWESLSMPTPIIMEWKNFDPAISNAEWCSTSEAFSSDREILLELHTTNPREYQFDRSPSTMFEHWIGWQWQQNNAIVHICHEVEVGYVVISKPDNVNDVYVSEWRAPNIDIERKLLKLGAEEIRRRQHQQTNAVRFHGLPQYMSVDELKQWGNAMQIQRNERTMIRNIRLPTETIEKIKTAYSEGSATFWPADFF